VRAAVEIARGRIRIIAGAGSNSTSQAIEMTRSAEAAGADAVLSVVPYYNKPMQVGIHAHFRAIAVSTSLPIILHDVPSRTIRGLSDDTLARLAKSAQFIGLRDGTADLSRPPRLRSLLPPGFRLLSGDDATALAFIANGGDGCISLVSNVAPDLCEAIFFELQAGAMAVRPRPAVPAGAVDGSAGKREPGGREICALPAGFDLAGHPAADRRTGRCGEDGGGDRDRRNQR
jgi:4-hydroxy-tetrahydrodipicolinate synthase